MQTEKTFPNWIWGVYTALFALSIPWYLSKQQAMHLVFGLPSWVILSILAVVLIAGFTLWVIQKYWKA